MSSYNDGSNDDSNEVYNVIEHDHQWTQDCEIMTDSGSDDDSDGIPLSEGSVKKEYGFETDGSNSYKRHSYDTDNDDGYSKRFSIKREYNDDPPTDSSPNDVECYSPSKELRRQSAEYRNSVEDYLPSPKKVKKEVNDSSSHWNNLRNDLPFRSDSFSDYTPVKEIHSSKDKYSLKKHKHDKSEKKSKSHGSRKRKYDDVSGSSSSHDHLSSDHINSLSSYKIPSGASLNVPIQGGIGASIMGKMGYQHGKGLGKHGQGRVDPVELSKQKGRQGLGLSIPNLDTACDRWDPSFEVIQVKEEVDWLESPNMDPPCYQELETWMEEGPRNLDIAKMNDFCDSDLLATVLSCKSVFDSMENMDLVKARSRSNPFEVIRKGIFQNRAAMKMANIDATFDFMFTSPTNMDGIPLVNDDKLLYFADVCAGPGGFSEYVLWKKKWKAKGIGFTLRGENDFKLEDFKSGPPETFVTYYGSKGDGDVFDPENINDLTKLVMNITNDEGVHFMMADGGFSVEGQENIQELLSKQLYLCQFLVALSIVRIGGHFVCKLFDIFSPFSVGLVYLMYRCFQKICIFKPNTSRPANSERYIVCKWKKHDTAGVKDYMYKVNLRLCKLGNKSSVDVNYCVPMDELKNDSKFFEYIITSNNKLGERQVVNLAKISAFYRDENLVESRQFNLRRECLSLWQIPDKISISVSLSVEDVLQKLFPNNRGTDFLQRSPTKMSPDNVENVLKSSIYDWQCIVLGNSQSEVTYFLGLGRDQVARYQFSRGRWDLVGQCNFELSPGTLVLGEIVTEYVGEGRNPRKCSAFHILDAFSLGFDVICNKEYTDRKRFCELYCKAISKSFTSNLGPVRVIKSLPVENIEHIFKSVLLRDLKGGSQSVVEIDNFAFVPKGILFFSTTKEPWAKYKSRGTGHYYYAHPKIKESEYEENRPKDSMADFMHCVSKNAVWWWEEGVGLKDEGSRPGVLHKNNLLNLIHVRTHR